MKRNQLEMLITLEKCTTMKEAANILNKNPSTIGRKDGEDVSHGF